MVIVQGLLLLALELVGSYLSNSRKITVSMMDVVSVIIICIVNQGRSFISSWMILLLSLIIMLPSLRDHAWQIVLVKGVYFYSLCYLSFYLLIHLFDITLGHDAFYLLSKDVVFFQGIFGILCILLICAFLFLQHLLPPMIADSLMPLVILLSGTCYLQGLSATRVHGRMILLIVLLLSGILFLIMVRMQMRYLSQVHVSNQYRQLLETQRVYNDALIQNRMALEAYQHRLLETMTSLNSLMKASAYDDVMKRLDADIAFIKAHRDMFQTRYLLIDGILETMKQMYAETSCDLQIERLSFDLKDIQESDIAMILYLMLYEHTSCESSTCHLATRKDMLFLNFSFRGKRLMQEHIDVVSQQVQKIIHPYQGFLTIERFAHSCDVSIMIPCTKNT